MGNEKNGVERRQSVRIKKNYLVRFRQKENPFLMYDISQIENISRGGLCFTSTISFNTGETLSIELRAPYLPNTIYLEGTVCQAEEKVLGLIYQIRLQFQNLTPFAAEALDKIEKYNINGDAR